MAENIAGIDPHQNNFTIGVIDPNGVEISHDSFDNTGEGYIKAIDLLSNHDVGLVGVEGSAKLGAHVSIALAAAGFDCREVPPQRSAAQRQTRRLAKTDVVDSYSTARALLAEPTLSPVQALETVDPYLAELEAVLEHRRMLVSVRIVMLTQVADQIVKLPSEICDQLTLKGSVPSRLNQFDNINLEVASTLAGEYRLSWLIPFIRKDREQAKEIKGLEKKIVVLLDQHGTSLREEDGIGPIAAATLLCEVGDPFRFSSESKFSRWCGVGAVALSSGEGRNKPMRHRLDMGGNRRVNSVIHVMSVTQVRANEKAKQYLERKTSEGKTRKEARRAHKKQLANRIIRRMWKDQKHLKQQTAA